MLHSAANAAAGDGNQPAPALGCETNHVGKLVNRRFPGVPVTCREGGGSDAPGTACRHYWRSHLDIEIDPLEGQLEAHGLERQTVGRMLQNFQLEPGLRAPVMLDAHLILVD